MNDIDEEGVYIWEDGSLVTYIKFAPDEPNNYGGDEDCMILWVGGAAFADARCAGWGGHFICETDYNTFK